MFEPLSTAATFSLGSPWCNLCHPLQTSLLLCELFLPELPFPSQGPCALTSSHAPICTRHPPMESVLCSQPLWWPHFPSLTPPMGQEISQGPLNTEPALQYLSISQLAQVRFHHAPTETTPRKSWDSLCKTAGSSSREV